MATFLVIAGVLIAFSFVLQLLLRTGRTPQLPALEVAATVELPPASEPEVAPDPKPTIQYQIIDGLSGESLPDSGVFIEVPHLQEYEDDPSPLLSVKVSFKTALDYRRFGIEFFYLSLPRLRQPDTYVKLLEHNVIFTEPSSYLFSLMLGAGYEESLYDERFDQLVRLQQEELQAQRNIGAPDVVADDSSSDDEDDYFEDLPTNPGRSSTHTPAPADVEPVCEVTIDMIEHEQPCELLPDEDKKQTE
ncbi:MAG: hypothetical protein V1738_01420 [Patescibacteria group bacterium]